MLQTRVGHSTKGAWSTLFPGSLFFLPSLAPGDEKKRDPGNEVGAWPNGVPSWRKIFDFCLVRTFFTLNIIKRRQESRIDRTSRLFTVAHEVPVQCCMIGEG